METEGKAYPLTLKAIKGGLPLKEHAANLDVLDFAAPHFSEWLLDPTRVLKPEDQ